MSAAGPWDWWGGGLRGRSKCGRRMMPLCWGGRRPKTARYIQLGLCFETGRDDRF